jgi:hypothetical protein
LYRLRESNTTFLLSPHLLFLIVAFGPLAMYGAINTNNQKKQPFSPSPIHYHSLLIDCCILHIITLCHVSSCQNQRPFFNDQTISPQVQGNAGQVGYTSFFAPIQHSSSTLSTIHPIHPLPPLARTAFYPSLPCPCLCCQPTWFIIVFAVSP